MKIFAYFFIMNNIFINLCAYIHLALPLSSNLAMCLFYFLGFNFLTHIYLHSKHNCNKNKEKKESNQTLGC